MKKSKYIKCCLGLGICTIAMILGVSPTKFGDSSNQQPREIIAKGLDVEDEDAQYLGYGYDITAGKPIIDTTAALKLQNPILDVDNAGLANYMKMKTGSSSFYESFETSSVREMARSYGASMSGQSAVHVKMNIYDVNVNVNNMFSMAFDTSKRVEERYAYYTMFVRNRLVYYEGVGRETLSQYLHPAFVSSSKSISSIEDATNFLNKYGTHLVTGYHLGGVFEMTNYFATISSTYVRKVDTSFETQVKVAVSDMASGEAGTNFTSTYAAEDNNSFASTQYKCTTYGGYSFPGLTIDQAFTVTQSIYGTGYVYQLWTDSINAGKNLIITDIPETTKMIPVFNLLPETAEFDNARTYLIKAFIKKAGISYRQFLEMYPDVVRNVAPSKLPPQDIGYLGVGYEVFEKKANSSEYNSRYISSDDYSDEIKAIPGSIISFDFDQPTYYGRELEWSISNSSFINVLDNRNGVFEIVDNAPTDSSCTLTLKLDDTQIYQITLRVKGRSYSGGKGFEDDPYILSTEQDIYDLMNTSSDWSGNKYFRLEDDIVLRTDSESDGRYTPIGNATNKFTGNFDGNYHTIYNLRLGKNCSTNVIALFAYNTGTISNLTLDADKKVAGSLEPNVIKNYTNEHDMYYNMANIFATICGVNTGKITNCIVKNATLDVITYRENKSSIDDNSLKEFDAAIICAQNSGIITKCSVRNSKLNANAYVSYSGARAGGICSKNTSTGEISYCSVIETTLDLSANINTRDENTYQYLGGIAAFSECSVSNCLVRSVNRNSDGNYFKIYGYCKNTWGYAENANAEYTYFGVIMAVLSSSNAKNEKGKFTACIVDDVKSLDFIVKYAKPGKEFSEVSEKTSNVPSAILYRQKDNASSSFSNCYFEENGSMKGYKDSATTDGITSMANLRFDDLPSDIKSDDLWSRDSYGNPDIVIDSINRNNIEFNFSKTKKVFYIKDNQGEAFQAGEIKISAQTFSGSYIDVKSYKVDYSNYENNKNIEGTWNIRVTACGVTASYQVRTVKVSTIGIEAIEDSAIELDYYGGDLFNPRDLIVRRLTERGVDESNPIPYKKYATAAEYSKGYYYDIKNIDSPLEDGLNTFEIIFVEPQTKETFTAYYQVYAKKAVVEEITIDESCYMTRNGGTINYAFSLPIGTTVINAQDVVGLVLKVKLEKQPYDADSRIPESLYDHEFEIRFDSKYVERQKLLVKYSSDLGEMIEKEIDASDVEFIHSTIASGENVVRVCFGGYLLNDASSFIVNGVYGDSTEKMREFTNAVNSFNYNDTLENQYNAIVNAIRIKDELSYLESDNDYILNCQRLAEIIENYNAHVSSINDAFANSIKIPLTFANQGFNSSGFLAFPLLLALLLLVL